MESTQSLNPNESTTAAAAVEKYSLKQCKNQILATAIVTLGSFSTGTVFGWSATATEALKKQPEFRDVSTDGISLVASLAILGAFFSGPVAGWMMDALGRKKSVIIFSLPFTLGWVIMCLSHFTHQFFWLYIGRALTGFCAGANLVVIPTYVKELAADQLRGVLGTMMPLMLVNGILYAMIIGSYCHWVVLTGCCGAIPILLGVGTLIVPETPRFLLAKDKRKKAIASIKWLYGLSSDELAEAKLVNVFSKSDLSVTTAKKSLKNLLTRPVGFPILIMVIIMFFQQFGGVNAVTMYTVEIFSQTGADFIQPHVATIILGVFQVVFVIVSMFLVDYLGRKVLLISCGVIMGLGLLSLGTYFYLKEQSQGEEKSVTWLPLVSTLVYIAAYSAGVGPVPWVLASELYNPHYRAESATIMTSFYWIFGWIVAQTYENLKSVMKSSGAFYFYACFCFGGALFSLVFVPETKGKSGLEIVEYFEGKTIQEVYRKEVGAGGDASVSNYVIAGEKGGASPSNSEVEESKSLVVK